MYFIHSAYYFVDRDGKWHPLGRNRVRALAKYGELTEAPGSLLRMGSLMDRYMKEVAPKPLLEVSDLVSGFPEFILEKSFRSRFRQETFGVGVLVAR